MTVIVSTSVSRTVGRKEETKKLLTKTLFTFETDV